MAERLPFVPRVITAQQNNTDVEIASPNNLKVKTAVNETLSQETGMSSAAKKTAVKMESNRYLSLSVTDWLPILARECMVYMHGGQYIGKKYYEIHYKFMSLEEAKQTVIDNLWAILQFHYFPIITDEIRDRIEEIVKGCLKNLATFLMTVLFDDERGNCKKVLKRVPKSAIAFNNGIFDFKTYSWILKYNKIEIERTGNILVMYDEYAVMWNFNFDFEPDDWFDLNDISSFSELMDTFKSISEVDRNICTELLWNMSHDANDKFSEKRLQHLCEVVGYTLVQSFLQYFVILIGEGQNGKNSLLDGCLSSRIFPRPVSNSMDEIENDRFVTGSLCDSCHNIYLETSAKTYVHSDNLKALTGSQYQTIQHKGENKYQGIINCKYIFAGNDQQNIKFSDNTNGFRRRINLFEIFYTWDKEHRFKLRNPDYYDCDFSQDLHEIYGNDANTIAYIYFGMLGIKTATKNFTQDFSFNYTDWTDSYTDYDIGLREFFDLDVEPLDYIRGMRAVTLSKEDMGNAFFDPDTKTPLWLNGEKEFKDAKVVDYGTLSRYFNDKTLIPVINEFGEDVDIEEITGMVYLQSHDIAMSIPYLWSIYKQHKAEEISLKAFTDNFVKVYRAKCKTYTTTGKQKRQYVLCRLKRNKIVFVEK